MAMKVNEGCMHAVWRVRGGAKRTDGDALRTRGVRVLPLRGRDLMRK